VTVWIDEPIWPAHGRAFAHLVSDTSYGELHAVAQAAGLHPRSFDGDHYDVPDVRWHDAVAAGATPTSGVDLARRLNASGLRLRKRKHDRGVARQLDVPFPNGASDVDLVASPRPVDERRVFAAMVFVRDSHGDFAVVYSIRRRQWGSPGGWREASETPLENAVREAHEETGLVLVPQRVSPCGYERFTPRTDDNVIDVAKPYLQVFHTELDAVRPSLTNGDDGIHATRWVTPKEYAALCRHLFWWPLAAEVFPDLRGLVPARDRRMPSA
jgi:8-oxo-dGTP pyrophosphatase MutT (NUDIX family)